MIAKIQILKQHSWGSWTRLSQIFRHKSYYKQKVTFHVGLGLLHRQENMYWCHNHWQMSQHYRFRPVCCVKSCMSWRPCSKIAMSKLVLHKPISRRFHYPTTMSYLFTEKFHVVVDVSGHISSHSSPVSTANLATRPNIRNQITRAAETKQKDGTRHQHHLKWKKQKIQLFQRDIFCHINTHQDKSPINKYPLML